MNISFKVWPNEKKSDKHPDFKGFVTIEGVDHELAGWKREKGGWTGLIKLKQERKQEPSFGGDQEAPF